MSKIQSQINELRKKIYIPWKIEYTNKEVLPSEFKLKTIYVHIWIIGDNHELVDRFSR